jgi:tRNA nucleotidyltransferase/poly(A) polymerase
MNLESLAHGSVLPASLVEKVPQREKLILSFVLAFLKEQRLPAQLLVNGGYVRDLLLGKTPDDLDLSLCLRDCPADVSLASVMAGMEGFAKGRPELQVSSVQITTILSDTSKDKNIDTAKAHLGVGKPPVRVEVDFMPTIGEETYDETDRVPTRDVRGTPEQDALRRDLTIGALLLEVSAAAEADDLDAHAAAKGMSWKFLDYYGGLADLRRGVLRSPYPRGRPAAVVWAEVILSAHEQKLAAQLGVPVSSVKYTTLKLA